MKTTKPFAANAPTLRALSMDAVQKAKSGHPGPRWVWLTLPKCCGVIS